MEEGSVRYGEIPDRFFEEKGLERFRRRLPRYRQEEFFQEYDVVQAHYLLHLLRRQPESIEVEPLARLYGFLPGQSFFFFKVDREAAMRPRTKLARPLIAISEQKYPLIDGLHRLYRAAHTGEPQLLCCFLSQEEARFCRRLP
jgi:hypothetical protein